ncbi:hypothetical protein F4678DRAFT_185658 [Xylaria arbuscula]|nr:hypothetical protein F4678DRAFT_185658 [Xylaria arbuscula]
MARNSKRKEARHSYHDPLSAPSQSSAPYRSLSSSVSSHHNLLSSDPNDNADDSTTPQTLLLELYGSIDTKIVGTRYYNGIATLGESILCSREVGNQYDANAVRIDNTMGRQIGYLPRNLVQKLAPYIDRRDVVLSGTIIGHKGRYDCPIRLYFYSTSDLAARLKLEAKLKADGLLKATSALDVFNIDEATLSAMPQATQSDSIRSNLLHQLQVIHSIPALTSSNA